MKLQVLPCKPYHSKTISKKLIRMPNGLSAFKLYYLNIVGRENPERYEWRRSPLSRNVFESRLLAGGIEGVGFITAFPHIMKIFRFAPEAETVLHVRALEPQSLAPIDLARDPGWGEFACYAEAAIAAGEYHAWATAKSVKQYLAYQSDFEDGAIASASKLAEWFEPNPTLGPGKR